MKKIYLMLIALPIILAVLTSCSDDDIVDPQPGQATSSPVAFMAGMDLKTTRVDYVPIGDTEVKCDWTSSDVGKTVVVKDSKTGETYDFKITSVTVGSNGKSIARIEYPDENQEAKPFPSRFQGTATFVVGTGVQVQGVNNPSTAADCAYLGNGVEIEADIPQIAATAVEEDGVVVYQYPDEPYKITFRHKNTCIFRVKFKAPAAITAGAKLRIYANGLDLLGEVTLNFALSKSTNYTAFVRCTTVTPPEQSQNPTIGAHDKPTPIEMLSFVIEPPTGTDSYVCRKFYDKIKDNGIAKNTNGLVSGYFYYTDISGIAVPGPGTKRLDEESGDPTCWSIQETPLANAIGFAPLYAITDALTGKKNKTFTVSNLKYFHIPLDRDHNLASSDDEATYYLYVAHDFLKPKTTPLSNLEYKIQMQTPTGDQTSTKEYFKKILYFYYGDVVGDTKANLTAYKDNQHFYGVVHEHNNLILPRPETHKYYYVENDTFSINGYRYTYINEDRTSNLHTQKYCVYDKDNDLYYVYNDFGAKDLAEDAFHLEDFEYYRNEYWHTNVMNPWVDAASVQWRGGWRCMSLNEANAFINATVRIPHSDSGNSYYSYGEQMFEPMSSTTYYVFQYKPNQSTTYELRLPATGDILGKATERHDETQVSGRTYHRTHKTNEGNELYYYYTYENIFSNTHLLYTWLRNVPPAPGNSKAVRRGLLYKTQFKHTYDTSHDTRELLKAILETEEDKKHAVSSFVGDGVPILPVLVVDKTGKPDIQH